MDLHVLARRSRPPITPGAHARVDFLAALVMLVCPPLLRLQRASVWASLAFGSAGVLIGACTNYPSPLRWSTRISLQAHRTIELLSFPVYAALPARLGVLNIPRDRTYFLLLLTAYIATHALTDWTRPDRSA